MRTVSIPCVFALLFVGLEIATLPAAGQANAAIPVIQLQDVPLVVAIENLARQSGMNYSIDPKVGTPAAGASANVTARWENSTAEQALRKLMEQHNLCLVQGPASTVWRITVTNHVAGQVSTNWVRADTNAPVPLIQFSNVDLNLALKQLAQSAKLELEIDPNVSRPQFTPGKPWTPPALLSARWENITPRQAIAAVCETYELALHEDPATSRVHIGLISNSSASTTKGVISK